MMEHHSKKPSVVLSGILVAAFLGVSGIVAVEVGEMNEGLQELGQNLDSINRGLDGLEQGVELQRDSLREMPSDASSIKRDLGEAEKKPAKRGQSFGSGR